MVLENTLDQHFASWEESAFRFGYGTGEKYFLRALKGFMQAVPEDEPYDYKQIERVLGSTVAWLMISVLCREGIIEYGTSTRFGWLSKAGKALRAYLSGKTVNELIVICSQVGHTCYRDACNCGPNGYLVEGEICPNPFWGRT